MPQARSLHVTGPVYAGQSVRASLSIPRAARPRREPPPPRATKREQKEADLPPLEPLPDAPASVAAVTLPSAGSPESSGFIYVGIDGDACHFHQDIIVRGRKGGWEAAERLVKEMKNTFGLKKDDPVTVVIQIFINQKGHLRNAWRQFRIHEEISAAFFAGLNEADPLLNVVNSGTTKEASDIKVKGGIEFHVKLAECTRVALAGLSDGAYASLLKSLITRGMRDKIVLLKTSDDVALMTRYITKAYVDDEYALPLVPMPADLFQSRPTRPTNDE